MVEATKNSKSPEKKSSASSKASGVPTSYSALENSLAKLVQSYILKPKKGSVLDAQTLTKFPEHEKRCLTEIQKLQDSEWQALPDAPAKYPLDAQMWSEILKWSQNPLLAIQLWGENSTSQLLKSLANLIKQNPEKAPIIFEAASKSTVLAKRKRMSLAYELSDLLDVTTLPSSLIIEFLIYLASNEINLTNHLLKLEYIEDSFNKLDDSAQAKFLLNLKKFHYEDFLLFFSRLEIPKVRVALLREVRASMTIEEVRKFYEWKNPTPKFSTVGLETKVIKWTVEEKLKHSNALPELLALWPLISKAENGYDLPKFQEKLFEEMARENPLAVSMRNPELGKLKKANDELVESVRKLNESLARLEENRDRLTEAINEANRDITGLRNRIAEMSKGDQIGLEARDNQIRIDLLRSLLPVLQKAVEAANAAEIFELLEKANIDKVGKPGARIPWNADSCESLTGEVSEIVEVVESGFTWFNGTQTINLKRILVKNT